MIEDISYTSNTIENKKNFTWKIFMEDFLENQQKEG